MGSILTAISNAFGAVMGYFGWANKRQELKNSPDVRAAAIAVQEQRVQDAAKKAIANEDTKTLGNDLSE